MRLLLCCVIALLVGCSTTVPISAKFPEAPDKLMATCPQLKTLNKDSTTLSEVAKTVTINYTTYYDCAVKLDGWIEWYNVQKIIFESVK
jgi:hypothetical protein